MTNPGTLLLIDSRLSGLIVAIAQLLHLSTLTVCNKGGSVDVD
jgi:hypothetical protein